MSLAASRPYLIKRYCEGETPSHPGYVASRLARSASR